MKKIKIILILLFVTLLFQKSYCQVSISKTNVDFTLTLEQDSIYRILTFWKDKDSTIYTSVKYSVSDFNQNSTLKNLANEINIINQLWNIALDSIEIDLHSFNIGYPLLYSDILKNHIQAFVDSKEWQDHVKQDGKKLDYILQKKIMFEADVYKPLNNFLKTKEYSISGFETEKHGFVTKRNLQKAGFSGSEIIPMPFIVWARLDKLSK